jgi:DNA adenine methylase
MDDVVGGEHRPVRLDLGPLAVLAEDPDVPGGAGHVATALLALGAKVSCIGLIGQDPPGREMTQLLARTGAKVHGVRLPEHLDLTHVELEAGRSSQATLLGRDDATVESLYLSPALSKELVKPKLIYQFTHSEQMCLLEARG